MTMRSLSRFLMLAALSVLPAAASATSAATLRADVLEVAAVRLKPAGLHVDEARAQLVPSRPIGADETFSIVPLWDTGTAVPALPLTFELVSTVANERSLPARATLVASLQRDALVLRRRVARGTPVTCDDIEVQRKSLRVVPARALALPCALSGLGVAVRTLMPGDALRDDDVASPPDVPFQGQVTVRVAHGLVVLEHTGTALADARLGQRVNVRLTGSGHQVSGRVIGANVVLVEGTQ